MAPYDGVGAEVPAPSLAGKGPLDRGEEDILEAARSARSGVRVGLVALNGAIR